MHLRLPLIFGLSAFFAALLSLSRPAQAWVHWQMLDNAQYKHKLLIYTVLQTGHFNYCLQDQTRLIDRDSIEIQVARGVAVWSRAFEAAGVHGMTASVVESCSGADLQIEIGPNRYPGRYLQESYGFVTPVQDQNAPLYMQLNVSENPKITPYGDDTNLRIIDIKDALNLSIAGLGGFLDRLSFGGYNVGALIHDHPELTNFTHYLHLSYGIILHEMGHTFGLGDTYESGLNFNGSLQWRSSSQPVSLMFAKPFYNLQPDDQLSLSMLVKRVRAEIKGNVAASPHRLPHQAPHLTQHQLPHGTSRR